MYTINSRSYKDNRAKIISLVFAFNSLSLLFTPSRTTLFFFKLLLLLFPFTCFSVVSIHLFARFLPLSFHFQSCCLVLPFRNAHTQPPIAARCLIKVVCASKFGNYGDNLRTGSNEGAI